MGRGNNIVLRILARIKVFPKHHITRWPCVWSLTHMQEVRLVKVEDAITITQSKTQHLNMPPNPVPPKTIWMCLTQSGGIVG